MLKARTTDELAAAVNSGAGTIEITGDLTKKVIRIKATGKIAWTIAIGCIGIAAIAAIATLRSGGATAPVAAPTAAFMATGTAAALGGVEVAAAALALAVASGGVGVLSALYSDYRVTESSPGRAVLVRK